MLNRDSTKIWDLISKPFPQGWATNWRKYMIGNSAKKDHVSPVHLSGRCQPFIRQFNATVRL